MKRIVYIALLLPLGLLAQNWQTDFAAASSKANSEQKNILLVFSGSDWCAPCIKLDKKIWSTPIFKKAAAKNWVLYRADFPKKKKNKLKAEVLNQNKTLAEKYNSKGYFPLVVVLRPNGTVVGTTGFNDMDVESYIEHLKSL